MGDNKARFHEVLTQHAHKKTTGPCKDLSFNFQLEKNELSGFIFLANAFGNSPDGRDTVES